MSYLYSMIMSGIAISVLIFSLRVLFYSGINNDAKEHLVSPFVRAVCVRF